MWVRGRGMKEQRGKEVGCSDRQWMWRGRSTVLRAFCYILFLVVKLGEGAFVAYFMGSCGIYILYMMGSGCGFTCTMIPIACSFIAFGHGLSIFFSFFFFSFAGLLFVHYGGEFNP